MSSSKKQHKKAIVNITVRRRPPDHHIICMDLNNLCQRKMMSPQNFNNSYKQIIFMTVCTINNTNISTGKAN
uniref:Uncharacterized protein n=1 Tax=Arundo donax TaxID=35708 RepID=A0A0A9DPV8_ARUDO